MLTDDMFHVWCRRNEIGPETKAYIERIRSSQPVREVRNGYPPLSRKEG